MTSFQKMSSMKQYHYKFFIGGIDFIELPEASRSTNNFPSGTCQIFAVLSEELVAT